MSFLPNEDLETMAISQSVFHTVGPGNEHFQLLEAFDARPYSEFFLGRIRSLQSANKYKFLTDATVRTKIARIASDATAFQEESERLAESFNEAHRGSSAAGAFLLFSLQCQGGRLFALLKFEDEKVLSYSFEEGKRRGRMKPSFGEIDRTFVQNRNALQKAAIIRVDKSDKTQDEVWVVDRQNPQKPAAYFEQFLGAKRLRTESELTKKLIDITKDVARTYKDALPADAMATLSKRLYDATQTGGIVDGEKIGQWFTSIVGPLPADSPVMTDLQMRLRREGIAGESFSLDKEAVPAPRNRRVETESGIKIVFPAGLQESVVKVSRDKGTITIHDKITVDDLELEASRKSRP